MEAREWKNELMKIHTDDPQAMYQVKYADYDENTWTIPCLLNEKRIDFALNDLSVTKIKILLSNDNEILFIL